MLMFDDIFATIPIYSQLTRRFADYKLDLPLVEIYCDREGVSNPISGRSAKNIRWFNIICDWYKKSASSNRI